MNAVCWAIQNGNWSSSSTWAGGVIPDTSGTDLVYTNGFTVYVDTDINVSLLSNTARSRDIATPAMTANNAPSPFVAAANSISVSTTDAWYAFNRIYTTSTFWRTPNTITTGWLSIDFGIGNATIIDGYTIFGCDNQTFNPRNWVLQGSNDNSSWVDLHTVSGASAIPANGSYSVSSIGNSTSYRYYRLNITLNGGATAIAITELELYRPDTASIAAGGTFNFNTAGITAIMNSIGMSGSNTLFAVTNTSGTVTITCATTINMTGASSFASTITQTGNGGNLIITANLTTLNASGNSAILISKSNSGNLRINGSIFNQSNSSNNHAINGGGTGTITVTGDIFGASGSSTSSTCINNGVNTLVINGNVYAGTLNASTSAVVSSGTTTVNGNVFAATSNTSSIALSLGAVSLTINGDVYGGASAQTISTTGSITITINGNVYCRANANVIQSASAISVTINGNVYASALASAINLTTGTVYLKGNMYDVLGRVAIWCPNIFIDNTAVSLWQMSVGGGVSKTLYSADTFPNLPATSDVEFGIVYGPSGSLTGTMRIPAASDTRKNVPVGNTVGTADLTPTDWVTFLQSSNNDIAVRWRNNPTVENLINILKNYNYV